MPLDRAEALQTIMGLCPHCAKGLEPRLWQGEWCHTIYAKRGDATMHVTHTLCGADNYRRNTVERELGQQAASN